MGSVTFTSRIQNAKGHSEGCTGAVRYAGTGITPALFQVTRDGASIALTQDGAGAVKGTYGDTGFDIPEGHDATVNFTVTTTLPPGDVQATHRVLDAEGADLVSKAYKITVTEPE